LGSGTGLAGLGGLVGGVGGFGGSVGEVANFGGEVGGVTGFETASGRPLKILIELMAK